jgi:hypothetical protein
VHAGDYSSGVIRPTECVDLGVSLDWTVVAIGTDLRIAVMEKKLLVR